MELVSTNLGVAREAYQKFLEGDVPGVLEMLYEDAVYEYYAPAVHPLAGNFEGKTGVLHFYQLLVEHIELFLFVPEEFINGGDTIVVTGREGLRSKKTGKSYEGRFVHISEWKEGKLKRLRLYPDTAGGVHIFSE